MPTQVSPGVYITENDFSDYISSLGTTTLGLVGVAASGPLNVPTLCTSVQEFINIFGTPNLNQYGAYAALTYLRQGTQLWFCRVAKQYVESVAELASGTTAGAFTFTLETSNPFAVGDYVRISQDGLRTTQNAPVTVINGLVVTLGVPILENYTTAAEIDQCSLALNANAANASASAEIIAYGRSGAGADTSLLPMVKFTAVDPGTWANFGSNAGIEVVIEDGGQFSNVNPVTGLSYQSANAVNLQGVLPSLPSVDTRAELNALTSNDGVGVGQTCGVNRDSVVTTVTAAVKSSSTITATVGSSAGLLVGDSIQVVGSVGGLNDGTFTILTAPTGTSITYTNAGGVSQADETASLEKTNGAHLATVYKCVTVTGSGSTWTAVGILTKQVKVLYQGNQVEVWNNLVGYDPTSPNFWNTVIGVPINPVSQYICAEYLGAATQGAQPMSSYDSNDWPNNPRLLMGNTEAVPLFADGGSSVSFSQAAGADGNDPNDADYIGTTDANDIVTGLQNFYKQQQFQVNLLAIPAVSDASVIAALIALLETRGDCLGIIDPPFGLSVQEVVDWSNGTGAYSGQTAFVTNKAALYWPWVKQIDPYSDSNVWMPPSVFVPGVIAASDLASAVWFAPAGITRGVVPNAIAVEYMIQQSDADFMYGPGNGNAVNPIMSFASSGIVLYGQRTLQRVPSALDRINVRRLVFYIEQSLIASCRVLVFEQNDAVLWNRFLALVNPFLTSLLGQQALDWYDAVCDATTNTSVQLNNNEMSAAVYLVASKSAEIISIQVNLLASGTNISEFVQNASPAGAATA
jgi:phage tail sheath protein FI